MNVRVQIGRLNSLTVAQLQAEYARATGEPTRSCNRPYLIRRTAYAIQAAAIGGLSERARARAAELARDQDLRRRPTREVMDAHAAAGAPTLKLAGAADGGPQAEQPVSTPTPPSRDLPPAGSLLVKAYRGRRLEVRVLADGFEFDRRHFRSLSAIAREVTGTTWNGRLFFGLAAR